MLNPASPIRIDLAFVFNLWNRTYMHVLSVCVLKCDMDSNSPCVMSQPGPQCVAQIQAGHSLEPQAAEWFSGLSNVMNLYAPALDFV
jgi:hypothetical protein